MGLLHGFAMLAQRSTGQASRMTGLFRVVLALLFVVIPVYVVRLVVRRLAMGHPFPGALLAVLTAVTGFLAYSAYVRWVEKRPLAEFAPEGAVGELGSGVLLGALLFSGTIGVVSLLGLYHVTGLGTGSALIWPLVGAAGTATIEEIVFRGVIFRITEESLGSGIALLVSASLFGLLHMLNPHATLESTIAIGLEAGILLAAAYMLTRRLWLPIGIHAGWNFTQGGIFGVAVSGAPVTGLLHGMLSGPAWLSGGAFGPEASIVAITVCTTAGAALLVWAAQQGRFRQPFWRLLA